MNSAIGNHQSPFHRIGLFLGVTPDMGGVYQYSQCLVDAVAALPRDEFDVVVAYTDPRWKRELDALDVRGVPVPAFRWTLGLGTLMTWMGIPVPWWRAISLALDPAARILRREGNRTWFFSSYSFVCYQMPVPSVGAIHDLMHRYERQFPESGSFGRYLWRERVFKRMCRWTRGLLVDSKLGKQQVVESYGADAGKIRVLPFVAPKYVEAEADCEAVRVAYDLPSKFVFYPAQFWEHKNHKRLVRAVALLRDSLPDVKLVLIGSKKNGYDSLVQLINELKVSGHVRFLGFVPQEHLTCIYRLARALVFPSFYGPTNIPPLEAFAIGCPVAASNVYGMPEQIGDAGVLFDPNSDEDVAGAVRRVWTDDALCANLVEKGHRRAAQWGRPQFNARFREIAEDMAVT